MRIFTTDLLLLPPPARLHTLWSVSNTSGHFRIEVKHSISCSKPPTSSHLTTGQSQILTVAHRPCAISPGSSRVPLLPPPSALHCSRLFLKPAMLSCLGAFDSGVPAAGEILPLHSYIIQCLTFFRSPPNATPLEKSSLQTIFQMEPFYTNPIPSPCFIFLHHISNYTPNISYVKFLLSVCLFPARM